MGNWMSPSPLSTKLVHCQSVIYAAWLGVSTIPINSTPLLLTAIYKYCVGVYGYTSAPSIRSVMLLLAQLRRRSNVRDLSGCKVVHLEHFDKVGRNTLDLYRCQIGCRILRLPKRRGSSRSKCTATLRCAKGRCTKRARGLLLGYSQSVPERRHVA